MKNNNKTSKKGSLRVNERWFSYFSKNKDEITMINLALKEIAPIKDKLNNVQVAIRANEPHTDSLSFKKQSDTLITVGDALANELKADNNSIYIAMQVGEGCKIYFYCSDTDLLYDSVSNVMAGFADFEFEVDFSEDKEWEVYYGLYPCPWQFQSMGNLRVIKQLKKKGDQLIEPREVKHTISFESKADRKGFLKDAKKQGFSVSDIFEDSSKWKPYGLEVSRVDKVDWINVDEYVLYLWELANQCNGFYDGWETWTKGSASPPPGDLMNDTQD